MKLNSEQPMNQIDYTSYSEAIARVTDWYAEQRGSIARKLEQGLIGDDMLMELCTVLDRERENRIALAQAYHRCFFSIEAGRIAPMAARWPKREN